jgi:hypothetical protein
LRLSAEPLTPPPSERRYETYRSNRQPR